MSVLQNISRRQFLFGAGAVGLLTSASVIMPQLGTYAHPPPEINELDNAEFESSFFALAFSDMLKF